MLVKSPVQMVIMRTLVPEVVCSVIQLVLPALELAHLAAYPAVLNITVQALLHALPAISSATNAMGQVTLLVKPVLPISTQQRTPLLLALQPAQI